MDAKEHYGQVAATHFGAGEGWFFRRVPTTGHVHVAVFAPAVEPCDDCRAAAALFCWHEPRFVTERSIDPETWASTVATVSRYGATGDRHAEALHFHGEED